MTTQIDKVKQAIQSAPKTEPGHALDALISREDVRKKFRDVLGLKSQAFLASVLSAYKQNPSLSACEPMSVLASAMIAATMDLPISSALGIAHIVPYGNVAQFQMGWKGFVQLAIRTGRYKTIHATPVCEGEVTVNKFTGEMQFKEKTSDKVVGYLSYFKLLDGFEKFYYMTTDEVRAHGQKYSKSFNNPKGRWSLDFDSMALKTVLKLNLSKYGILSTELQRALVADQASFKTLDVDVNALETEAVYIDAKEESPKQDKPIEKVKTALDVKIHQLKKEVGEEAYYRILSSFSGPNGEVIEHMTELGDLNKEVFFRKLMDESKEMKRGI